MTRGMDILDMARTSSSGICILALHYYCTGLEELNIRRTISGSLSFVVEVISSIILEIMTTSRTP